MQLGTAAGGKVAFVARSWLGPSKPPLPLSHTPVGDSDQPLWPARRAKAAQKILSLGLSVPPFGGTNVKNTQKEQGDVISKSLGFSISGNKAPPSAICATTLPHIRQELPWKIDISSYATPCYVCAHSPKTDPCWQISEQICKHALQRWLFIFFEDTKSAYNFIWPKMLGHILCNTSHLVFVAFCLIGNSCSFPAAGWQTMYYVRGGEVWRGGEGKEARNKLFVRGRSLCWHTVRT